MDVVFHTSAQFFVDFGVLVEWNRGHFKNNEQLTEDFQTNGQVYSASKVAQKHAPRENTTNIRKILTLIISRLQGSKEISLATFCESKTTFYLCRPSTGIVDGSSGK